MRNAAPATDVDQLIQSIRRWAQEVQERGQVSDKLIDHLTNSPDGPQLYLSSPVMVDLPPQLAEIRSLTDLTLDMTRFEPQSVQQTLSQMPQLQTLRLFGAQFDSPDVWEALRPLQSLRSLDLFNSTATCDPPHWFSQQHFPALSSLAVPSIIIESGAVLDSHLSNFDRLQSLTVYGVDSQPRRLAALSSMPELRELHLLRSQGLAHCPPWLKQENFPKLHLVQIESDELSSISEELVALDTDVVIINARDISSTQMEAVNIERARCKANGLTSGAFAFGSVYGVCELHMRARIRDTWNELAGLEAGPAGMRAKLPADLQTLQDHVCRHIDMLRDVLIRREEDSASLDVVLEVRSLVSSLADFNTVHPSRRVELGGAGARIDLQQQVLEHMVDQICPTQRSRAERIVGQADGRNVDGTRRLDMEGVHLAYFNCRNWSEFVLAPTPFASRSSSAPSEVAAAAARTASPARSERDVECVTDAIRRCSEEVQATVEHQAQDISAIDYGVDYALRGLQIAHGSCENCFPLVRHHLVPHPGNFDVQLQLLREQLAMADPVAIEANDSFFEALQLAEIVDGGDEPASPPPPALTDSVAGWRAEAHMQQSARSQDGSVSASSSSGSESLWTRMADSSNAAEFDESCSQFSHWLQQMRLTDEYLRTSTRADTVARVNLVLSAIESTRIDHSNPIDNDADRDFRRFCIAAGAQEPSCDDRPASILNSMEVEKVNWEARRGSLTPAALLRSGAQLFRVQELEKLGNEIIAARVAALHLERLPEHRRATARERVDDLEVHLHLRTSLRRELDLPGQTATMHFQRISGLTDGELADIKQKVLRRQHDNGASALIESLLKWPPWRTYIERSHPENISRLTQTHGHEVNRLDSLELTNEVAEQMSNSWNDYQAQLKAELIARTTEEIVRLMPGLLRATALATSEGISSTQATAAANVVATASTEPRQLRL